LSASGPRAVRLKEKRPLLLHNAEAAAFRE
jgi:hypothetical protein